MQARRLFSRLSFPARQLEVALHAGDTSSASCAALTEQHLGMPGARQCADAQRIVMIQDGGLERLNRATGAQGAPPAPRGPAAPIRAAAVPEFD
jgi:hypothetical protein